jgi:hypothetical protein
MLGKTTKNKPVLLKEPLYPKELSVNESLIKILDDPLEKVQKLLIQVRVLFCHPPIIQQVIIKKYKNFVLKY